MEKPRELDFVPPQNEREIAQSIQTHIGVAVKLEEFDGTLGQDDATSMVAQLGQALGIG